MESWSFVAGALPARSADGAGIFKTSPRRRRLRDRSFLEYSIGLFLPLFVGDRVCTVARFCVY